MKGSFRIPLMIYSIDDMNNPELYLAYENTHYKTELGVTLRINHISADLDGILESNQLDSACYITAWNPFSKSFLDKDNKAANIRLKKELLKLVSSDKLINGIGVDASGEWPGEESFLVLGLGEKAATNLAVIFGQNAYVLYEVGVGANLILTEHFKINP